MTRFVGLIRGINVGKAKRISMADLRAVVEQSGGSDVRTLLNSGNIVFSAPTRPARKIASAIEAAIEARFLFAASVVVISAVDLSTIVADNPLGDSAGDPARHLVAFPADPDVRSVLAEMAREKWKPDVLAVGSKAAYLWCDAGILESPLLKGVTKRVGERITTRNWTTVRKLLALAEGATE